VLGANVWIGGYELDLVAARGRTLVFCEVKSKSGAGFGDPLEMVGPEKVRRIRRAAEVWLAAHPPFQSHVVRFDVVAVRGSRLQCLRNAF
jgi:putative endonuclease